MNKELTADERRAHAQMSLARALDAGRTSWSNIPHLPDIELTREYQDNFAANFTERPPYEYDERDATTRDEMRWQAAWLIAGEMLMFRAEGPEHLAGYLASLAYAMPVEART
jgi:hypothetical protein